MAVSISLERLRHWTLRRQCLSRDAQGQEILEIIDRIIALHATDPLSPFLSLLARSPGFDPRELEGLLEESRQLAKVRFIRKTVHVLPISLLPVAFSALRSLLEPRSQVWLEHLGLSLTDYERLSRHILRVLRAQGGTAQEVKRKLGIEAPVSAVLNMMCDQGRLIRGLPRQGWKSNLHVYRPWDAYFPSIDPFALPEFESRTLIVQRYVEAFGPVTWEDVKWWTGFPAGQISRILKNIQNDLVECEVPELGPGFWMFPAHLQELQDFSWIPEPAVCLLPLLDPLLMGCKARARLIRQDYMPYVFDRSGNATSVILVDGVVRGIWDYKVLRSQEIKIFWLEKPGLEIEQRTQELACAAGRFLSGDDVTVRTCPGMIPLARRTAGGFMSPLKEEA